jgi:hypothetical protein
VSDEVLGSCLEPKLGVQVLHRALVDIEPWNISPNPNHPSIRPATTLTLMRSRILLPPVLQKLEEVLGPPLLKQAHQARPDSLHLRTRYFGDPAIPVHVASGNDLELEIADDIGVNKNTRELARRENELGNQVDGVITVPTELKVLRGRRPAELLI